MKIKFGLSQVYPKTWDIPFEFYINKICLKEVKIFFFLFFCGKYIATNWKNVKTHDNFILKNHDIFSLIKTINLTKTKNKQNFVRRKIAVWTFGIDFT